ncbi:hypothetical protein [Microbispora sp. GKU 823]|uniref:hypothetical protein n=1 Tax=Microbispora sp. GKU 823 TaxID=1652100 RepID=UPI0009A2D5BD|nr:hypothetical protein [Microbispora sp. GKU 823]OPG10578.1 hypothetical protein B1L11_23250 [Microbispora sp. GKU 823]
MSITPTSWREFVRQWWSFRPTGTGVLTLGGLMVGCRLLGLPLALAITLPILTGAGLAAVFALVELSNDRANRQQGGTDEDPTSTTEPVAGRSSAYAIDDQADPARHVDLSSGGDPS